MMCGFFETPPTRGGISRSGWPTTFESFPHPFEKHRRRLRWSQLSQFLFELGKIVKYANLNSDQLDLILGRNLARLLKIEPKPSAPTTMDIMQI